MSRVTCTIDDNQIAIVSLNRPDKLNAIDMEMFKAVNAITRELKNDKRVRAVIVRGEGSDFCSGLDVKSLLTSKSGALSLLFKWWPTRANDAQRFSLGWRDIPCPVIFSIHGRCWGGGLQLASGGDFRIASPDATFSIMEAKWGLIPDMGGAIAFRELMRKDHTLEMAMTAKEIDSQTAKEYGLVTKIADDPYACAYQLALECINRSPDVLAANKKLYHNTWWSSQGKALLLETWYQIKVGMGKNRVIAGKRERNPDDKPDYLPRKFK
ncbi:enoyl-CoA hydratase [Vibrio breoganii]|uniref:Enoyl-CoA hydratase n=1 Tax=Vibrio breoganii TaxID=553239 RepID=A0AAN0XUV0_9VIBR|nr:crotonase/enoyl-CoA hydratase family protein [Vibrio breoganii]ANO33117.1 enoyl-CoA hydratase [Vibrio breoganii]NMO73768.1 crotonase/enoyl-CoA hydratase family protein [Vibrio breoganii]NMR70206.1 crotonase/enoyl-CoA hydratase family protein [Vibrio breoganii]OCH73578.1 enoyl-CoA hydratase [Vibrio breoganii]OED93604.1 enoyl-CoA hydratase [Vibrio breoganii ZF-29]